MKYRRTSRFLSIVLLIAMVLTLMPTVALAEEETEWQLVTKASQIKTDGTTRYAIIGVDPETEETFALSGNTSKTASTQVYLTGGSILFESNQDIKTNDDYVWLRESNTKLRTLTSGSGVNLSTSLTMNSQGSKIAIENIDPDTGFLDLYTNGNTKYALNYVTDAGFKMTKGSTSSNNTIRMYVLVNSGEEPVEPPVAEISTIAEALAGENGATFTVKGVVTLVEGKNIYIQDATGGICLYLPAAATDIALGDTLIGTGSRGTYRGMPQLSGATYEKSEGLTLTAKETTIGALTAADVCTYVKLTGLTVTEVFDNNGSYSTPNITVKDASDNTIQIYKAVIGKTDGAWDVAVDDVIDFTGAVGVNNTTLQLRNTLASEITVASETPAAPAAPTASVPAGEVEAGTVVTFSSATEGAVVFYSTDDGASWTEGSSYTVNEAVTLKVKAVLNGVDSEIASFAYTIKAVTPEPSYSTIAEALAGENGATFTVKGVVTLLDGNNIYVQDATGGICVRAKSKPSDLSLGDTIIGTGARAVYNGLPQLNNSTYEKSEGLTLTAKETTIGALTAADVCTYVKLTGLTVTEVYDNNGSYSAPNITVEDESGSTIQIYKAVVGKTDGAWDVAAGDVIDFTGAVGIYNTTFQLRNTLPTEIVKHTEPETKTGLVTDLADLTDGSYVVIYNPGNSLAMTSEVLGNDWYLAAANVTPENDQIAEPAANTVWKVTVGEDGSYTFTQDSKAVTGWLSGTYQELTSDATHQGAATGWKLETCSDEDHSFFMSSSTLENFYIQVYSKKINGESTLVYCGYKQGTDPMAYGMQFYLVAAPETPDDPTPEEATYGLVSKDSLQTGDKVILFNTGASKGVSTTVISSNYLAGVDLTPAENVITTDNDAVVWEVTVNADGTYTFKNGSSTLGGTQTTNASSGKIYNNIKLSDPAASAWTAEATGTDKAYYLYLGELPASKDHVYMDWYANYSEFSLIDYSAPGANSAFFFSFYKQGAEPEAPSGEATDDGTWDGVLTKGQQYVIYNASAEGVLGIPNDMGNALTNVPAAISGGKATVSNGAMVFTVADNPGRYYIFEAGGKYLATNNAEEVFLQDEIDEYTKWYLTRNGSGYLLYNKTANYNGTPVCLEFFSGSFSGWTFKSSNADIFRFNFYPVADGTAVVNGVAQVPTVEFACEDTRFMEQDYDVKFTLNDLAPEITDLVVTYTIGDTTEKAHEISFENKIGTFTLPAVVLDANGVISSFTITVSVTNSYGLSYTGAKTVTVLDEPFIGKLTPAANAQTGDDKRPVISAEIGNVGENAVFTMTVNDQPVEATYTDGVLSYQAAEDMADGRYTVIVTVERADGKAAEKMWSFYVGKAQFQLFFGQLHSHTTYSDGSGSLESALDYIAAIPASANVQFVAFTDHSNYFDSTSAANPEAALYDVSQMTAASKATWDTYKQTVADFNARQSDIVAIAGFEMTWSGGPGHINTFNTPGIVSRNNSTLNSKTNDAGMKAYYTLLDNEALANALSQFNHPGKTFGNFTDFSYWDAVTDSRIYLVEVGNGEGQIGAGGYYPSYEQYIMALDKGWHVGPTNNQDNHKGRWGNANDARDVIYTDDFSEQGIYQAIRDYRIYATEDKNLEIQYNVNGEPLGTIFSEVPEELAFSVSVYDPDSSDSITKVELVANSGKVAYTWDDPNQIKTGLLETTLAPTYSYYFVRVTQADGDLAVTAPVWVGESLKLGISAVECGTSTPVTGEEFTLSTTFYNNEAADAVIKSVTYTVNGSEVIGTDNEAGSIPANSTKTVEFKYTPLKAKIMTVTVRAVVELNGEEYTFTKDVELEVKDADALVYIGIDASHYNEYVAGNYKDSMGNFGALAAGYGVRTVELKTSEELIAACSNEKFVAIIFTAPSRRLAAAQSDPKTYSADELDAIAAFNQAGGQVIVCGWGDNYENYDAVKTAKQMAETQNELLSALGSSIRLGDDEVVDDELNGGQNQRLYLDAYNFNSYLMQDVVVDPDHPNDRKYSEVYSNYGGCSVFFEGTGVPATVTPIVYGHDTTYTKDCDGDGKNDLLYPYGEGNRVVVMASEQLADKGLIIVAGAAFMSNFEVQAAASNDSSDADQQMNYANYKICENLVKGFNEITVTPIAQVQEQTEIGLVYTIEGVVTSNASGYDKDTAFFDCIYVQDETAGICCFPVSGNYKIGDKVRITGYTDFYQAEMELQVMSIEVIGETDPVQPTVVTAAQINDLSVLGSLVTLKGTVESFELENGLVQTIMVKDAAGNVARVFIDGYITTAEAVKDLTVGCRIEATGLSSYDNTWKDTSYFPRIRVRSRADIICTAAEDEPAAIIKSTTVMFDGKIHLRFDFLVPDAFKNLEGAYVSFEVKGEEVQRTLISKGSAGAGGVTMFYLPIMIPEFADMVTVKFHDADGTVLRIENSKGTDYTERVIYSAKTYAERIMVNGKTEKDRNLAKALYDYGTAAQIYFQYGEWEDLAVDSSVSAVTLEELAPYALATDGTKPEGLAGANMRLYFEADNTLRIFFKLDGEHPASNYTFKVDGKTAKVKSSSATQCYLDIKNIPGAKLSKMHTVSVSDGTNTVTLTISALSYAYNQAKKDDVNLQNLGKALYLYAMATEDYFSTGNA